MHAAIKSSCQHKAAEGQVASLEEAGHPEGVILGVAISLLSDLKQGPDAKKKDQQKNVRPAVIANIHGVSHYLKKAADIVYISVVFSVSCQLNSLCHLADKNRSI